MVDHNQHILDALKSILSREENLAHFYKREQDKVYERLIKLEHVIYTGNGRPSLIQQITELNLKLDAIAETLAHTKSLTSQKQVAGFQVAMEAGAMIAVALLSAFLAVWLNPHPKVVVKKQSVPGVPDYHPPAKTVTPAPHHTPVPHHTPHH